VSASCIGEPISWLRLESYALDHRDDKIAAHLASCAACAACLAEIRADVVALPPLVVPEKRAWFSWRWFAPAMGAIAAAALVLLLIGRRDRTQLDHVTTIKGAGDVVLGVVRERGGVIRRDVTSYLPGDRWKVVVTCAPGPFVWIDVAVVDPTGVDYPLGPAQLACGNEVAVPGAFEITGTAVNVVCARLDTEVIPTRTTPKPGDPGVACVTLTPEVSDASP
jgi:hypothetical protein